MFYSVRPHRRQPTRLPRPWDSPGKNTGVGCHFLLQRMEVKSEREVAQLCRTLSDPMDCSLPGSSAHGIFQARVLEWGAIAFSTLPCYSFPNLMYNSKPTHSGLHLTEFCMVMHSFLMINDSFWHSPGSLWELIHLKICSWYICGERSSAFTYFPAILLTCNFTFFS